MLVRGKKDHTVDPVFFNGITLWLEVEIFRPYFLRIAFDWASC